MSFWKSRYLGVFCEEQCSTRLLFFLSPAGYSTTYKQLLNAFHMLERPIYGRAKTYMTPNAAL